MTNIRTNISDFPVDIREVNIPLFHELFSLYIRKSLAENDRKEYSRLRMIIHFTKKYCEMGDYGTAYTIMRNGEVPINVI